MVNETESLLTAIDESGRLQQAARRTQLLEELHRQVLKVSDPLIAISTVNINLGINHVCHHVNQRVEVGLYDSSPHHSPAPIYLRSRFLTAALVRAESNLKSITSTPFSAQRRRFVSSRSRTRR
ncbi:hypothetical protein D9M68_874930 [compost metagenome]